MCSTDDPVDTLEWHAKLADSRLAGRVRPTFRPDAAMNIDKPTWSAYVDKLGARWNCEIGSLDDFLECLKKSHDFMGSMGCRASDHGVCVPYGYQLDKESAARIFNNVRGGNAPGRDEAAAFKAFILNEMAELDAEAGWVFQLHIGAVRDVRHTLEAALGADVGGDIGDHEISIVRPLLPLLNRFDNRLKVVLYNMVPCHNATLAMLSRAFGNKVALGSAWWLNDSRYGMKCQLESESTIDLFSNMSGMVSDSRKILSYGSRFEMYRRTQASVLGEAVERGEMPERVAVKLAKRLCYDRPKELFGF
jgi:glucuronate isomerase